MGELMPVRWKPSWTEPGSARDRLRDMVAEEREDVQGPFRPIDPDIQIDPAKLPASFQVKPTASARSLANPADVLGGATSGRPWVWGT